MMNITDVSSWMRDPNAYDPQARERRFTFNGERFTAHSSHADSPDVWPMTIRTAINSQFVATVSNWTLLPQQLAEALKPASQSGYTPCACRDCVDVTVSSDTSKPKVCDECFLAGCEAYRPGDANYEALPAHMRECLRDDAYEEAQQCEGHYDDDDALTSGVGIGEGIYCDGSCVSRN